MSSATPALSPAATALLNAIAAAAPTIADPWAKYPAVLNVKHVGEILGMEPKSVGDAARTGRIPMKLRLNRYVIDQVAFRAWLSEGGAAR